MEKKNELLNLNNGFDGLLTLQKLLLDTLDYEKVVYKVVNTLLFELGFIEQGYRIIVLTLLNKKKNILERVALSQTKEAEKALKASAIPFHQIGIPLRANENLLIKTLKEKKMYVTHRWPDIFKPILTAEQALTNQNAAGIKTSMLVPVFVREEAIGVLIFSMVKSEKEVSKDEKKLIQGFSEIVGLAVQNSRLYSDLADTKDSLVKANHKLKELDSLKDEFVSIASHELRTPMTAIKSYLWMALNQPGQEIKEPLTKYLNVSYSSTERLIRLVNDMLTVSRIERNKIELKLAPVDVFEIAKAVFDELKITADERKIHLTLNKAEEVRYMVNADREKLREVFQNIVGNALKFTPADGNIKIQIEKQGNIIKSSVTDTGPGIPKESMGMLFKKFSKIDYSYAKHSNQPGTGLGLYISKQIVSLHNGDIQVQSEVNVGTTFTVSLPSLKNSPEEKKT